MFFYLIMILSVLFKIKLNVILKIFFSNFQKARQKTCLIWQCISLYWLFICIILCFMKTWHYCISLKKTNTKFRKGTTLHKQLLDNILSRYYTFKVHIYYQQLIHLYNTCKIFCLFPFLYYHWERSFICSILLFLPLARSDLGPLYYPRQSSLSHISTAGSHY